MKGLLTNVLDHRSIGVHDEVDFFSDSARIFKCMAQLWEREVNEKTQGSQDELLQQCTNIDLGVPSDFAMDWDGTSFFMNMFSSV